MDAQLMLAELIKEFPALMIILSGLGLLVVAGQAYIAMTPNKKDDAWYDRMEKMRIIGPILKALASFAPLQRREKK